MANETVSDIDGNFYTTVKIGTQVWMVENFRSTKYNDGTPITLVSGSEWGGRSKWEDLSTGAYCYYPGSVLTDLLIKTNPIASNISNKDEYGALYNWYTVATGKLAPKGWHVPSDEEWNELEKYMIANGYNWDGTKEGNKIAKALAAQTGWMEGSEKYDPVCSGAIGNDLKRNNSSGFSAPPGGYLGYGGEENNIIGCTERRFIGVWWSATEFDNYCAWHRCLSYKFEDLRRSQSKKWSGKSVRLLMDN
jgi:uncharacterized protein (TIGR02145 family)